MKHLSSKSWKQFVKISENSYRLKYAEKKQLLKNCIYGVDKDFSASHSTRLGKEHLFWQNTFLPKYLDNWNKYITFAA